MLLTEIRRATDCPKGTLLTVIGFAEYHEHFTGIREYDTGPWNPVSESIYVRPHGKPELTPFSLAKTEFGDIWDYR